MAQVSSLARLASVLSGVNGASPWAANASESAGYLVETALGNYFSGMITEWSPPAEYDRVGVASMDPDQPNVWSDGSLVLDQVTGVSSSGAGFFAHQADDCWGSRRWGHVDRVRPEGAVSSCRGFCSVPGPLQSVQRAELWGVILALQSFCVVHMGVDNLGVVRHVGRLLDGSHGSPPLELVHDGDLFSLLQRMLHLRSLDTVRITKVKGHADEGMVLDVRVREDDKLGNAAADEAADVGRRRVGNAVIDARRNLSGVCGRWYLVILDLHRFFISISRAVVNHDGHEGNAPDPPVGALPKRGGLVHAVRDRAFLTGPPCNLGFGMGLIFLLLLSVLRMLLSGVKLQVLWLNGLPFLELCIGLLGVWTLVLVVFHMLNNSFSMNVGLVRG